jgi:hypothetical protein
MELYRKEAKLNESGKQRKTHTPGNHKSVLPLLSQCKFWQREYLTKLQ